MTFPVCELKSDRPGPLRKDGTTGGVITAHNQQTTLSISQYYCGAPDTDSISFPSYLVAPRGLRGAARSQPLHAVPGLPGCGSPPGPAPVPPPCAPSPPTLPTRVWHRRLVCQRVGLAGLLLYDGQGGGGPRPRRHVLRVVLRSRPGACAQR